MEAESLLLRASGTNTPIDFTVAAAVNSCKLKRLHCVCQTRGHVAPKHNNWTSFDVLNNCQTAVMVSTQALSWSPLRLCQGGQSGSCQWQRNLLSPRFTRRRTETLLWPTLLLWGGWLDWEVNRKREVWRRWASAFRRLVRRSGAASSEQSGAAVGANMELAAALSSVLSRRLLETSQQNKMHSPLPDAVLWLWGLYGTFKGQKHKWKADWKQIRGSDQRRSDLLDVRARSGMIWWSSADAGGGFLGRCVPLCFLRAFKPVWCFFV